MVSPKTYTGYNQEGKAVTTSQAVDANNYINPSEVQAAINKVNEVIEQQMQNIVNALKNVTPDAEDAVIVQGTKMTQAIEDNCNSLSQLPATFMGSINDIYTQAVAAHDRIQTEANDAAQSAAWNGPDVVSVS